MIAYAPDVRNRTKDMGRINGHIVMLAGQILIKLTATLMDMKFEEAVIELEKQKAAQGING